MHAVGSLLKLGKTLEKTSLEKQFIFKSCNFEKLSPILLGLFRCSQSLNDMVKSLLLGTLHFMNGFI